MAPEALMEAATAFWLYSESPEIEAQHTEALVLLATRLKFRPKTLETMATDRLARYLANVTDLSDAIATRALIAFHFAVRRPLMAAFLDALNIAHENGLITTEELAPPPADELRAAMLTVRESFAPSDVELYLRTLSALDNYTWGKLDEVLPPQA